MGEAAVQCEHHDKYQNKHRQADNGDFLRQCGKACTAGTPHIIYQGRGVR